MAAELSANASSTVWARWFRRRPAPPSYDRRATLQASQMGRPIYERMGYRTIAEFTVWDLER